METRGPVWRPPGFPSKRRHFVSSSPHGSPLEEMGVHLRPFDAENPTVSDLPPTLDGLVYFPGTTALMPFHRLTPEDFLHDFQVNSLGAAAVIPAALPALKAAPRASVGLFSTVAVAPEMAFHAFIAAAKAAVDGLTKSLAAELAPSKRASSPSPRR
jgi:3-oxoacyl-[acyl-carrier protein] reductase